MAEKAPLRVPSGPYCCGDRERKLVSPVALVCVPLLFCAFVDSKWNAWCTSYSDKGTFFYLPGPLFRIRRTRMKKELRQLKIMRLGDQSSGVCNEYKKNYFNYTFPKKIVYGTLDAV